MSVGGIPSSSLQEYRVWNAPAHSAVPDYMLFWKARRSDRFRNSYPPRDPHDINRTKLPRPLYFFNLLTKFLRQLDGILTISHFRSCPKSVKALIELTDLLCQSHLLRAFALLTGAKKHLICLHLFTISVFFFQQFDSVLSEYPLNAPYRTSAVLCTSRGRPPALRSTWDLHRNERSSSSCHSSQDHLRTLCAQVRASPKPGCAAREDLPLD